jgi:L-lactate dehydrogenase
LHRSTIGPRQRAVQSSCANCRSTVGADIKAGQSRLEVLGQNAGLIRSAMGELDNVSREAVVVIATTPVDILTRIGDLSCERHIPIILGLTDYLYRRAT